MEEIPLVMSSDERDFEADESDYLLPPTDRDYCSGMNQNTSKLKRCKNCFTGLMCG